jgi:NitT/TauT family transport system permease protein
MKRNRILTMNASTLAGNAALRIAGLALIPLFWEALSLSGLLDRQFFPSFTRTFVGMVRLWTSGLLATCVLVSLWRAVVGLLIAALVALPLGLFIGTRSRAAQVCANPLLRLLAQVNPFSIMPVFILLFGIGEAAKLYVVAWVCLWPLLFNTIEGARNADPALMKSALSMATPRRALVWKVVLPAASPSIFAGLKIGLEMSFFMLIAAEMISATYGLGWLLHNSAMNLQFVRLYAAAMATALLGALLGSYLGAVQRRFFFWREGLSMTSSGGGRTQKPFGKLDVALAASVFALVFVAGSLRMGFAKLEQQKGGQAYGNVSVEEAHHHAPPVLKKSDGGK